MYKIYEKENNLCIVVRGANKADNTNGVLVCKDILSEIAEYLNKKYLGILPVNDLGICLIKGFSNKEIKNENIFNKLFQIQSYAIRDHNYDLDDGEEPARPSEQIFLYDSSTTEMQLYKVH